MARLHYRLYPGQDRQWSVWTNLAADAQVAQSDTRVVLMDLQGKSDSTREHTLLLIVAFIALIFGTVMVWPDAKSQIRATGQAISGFIASDAPPAAGDSDLLTSTDDGVDAALDAFDDGEGGDDGGAALETPTTGPIDLDDEAAGDPNESSDDASSTASNALTAPSTGGSVSTTTVQTNSTGQASATTRPRPATTTTAASRPTTTTAAPTRPTTSTTVAPNITTTTTIKPPTVTTTTVTVPTELLVGPLYVDPNNVAANWVNANPGTEFTNLIDRKIASVPTAAWFGDWNNNVENDVSNYVTAAHNAGKIPALVVYNIPNRDCGQFSAGGASSASAYATWIGDLADGLDNGPAIIILEPDSLAISDCVDSSRTASLSNAVTTITSQCGECRVYLDAGHSQWIAPAEMANRLTAAGVLNADGFFTNVSNYNSTSNEKAFGQQVLAALGNPAGLGQIIDTSRNGNGSSDPSDWCDQQSSALGSYPSLRTGISTVHGYLWIKVPGESDGCVAPAGVFVPSEAIRLATN